MPKTIYILLFALFGMLMHSCGSTIVVSPENEPLIEHISKPKLVFLTYQIERIPENDAYLIILMHKFFKEGTSKSKQIEESSMKDNELMCEVLDVQKAVIESIRIKNPLFKTVEYLNEDKEFQKKEIQLEKAEFTVRMPWNKAAKYIAISMTKPASKDMIPLSIEEL